MTKAIHTAIKTQVETLGYPVAWENRKFIPTKGEPWIRSKFSPSDIKKAAVGVGAQSREVGVHFITVFAPALKGDEAASDMAQEVLDAFPIGAALISGTTIVRITKSQRKDGVSEPDWYSIPVVVFWRADY